MIVRRLGGAAARSGAATLSTASALRATCACTAPLMIAAGRVCCATCSAPIVADVVNADTYSQHDGSRPRGCSRERFLDVWKRAHDAGNEGATKDGRARVLTADAYARHSGRRSLAFVRTEPASLDDEAARELGLVGRAAGERHR